jgi:hypothetical protein
MECEMSAAFEEAKRHVREEKEGANKQVEEVRSGSPRQPASRILDELD